MARISPVSQIVHEAIGAHRAALVPNLHIALCCDRFARGVIVDDFVGLEQHVVVLLSG